MAKVKILTPGQSKKRQAQLRKAGYCLTKVKVPGLGTVVLRSRNPNCRGRRKRHG